MEIVRFMIGDTVQDNEQGGLQVRNPWVGCLTAEALPARMDAQWGMLLRMTPPEAKAGYSYILELAAPDGTVIATQGGQESPTDTTESLKVVADSFDGAVLTQEGTYTLSAFVGPRAAPQNGHPAVVPAQAQTTFSIRLAAE